MAAGWLTVAVGFAAGLLSGMFGIGGGLVTTPAIRLLLDQPALIAVGTPLLAILPTTIAGANTYVRSGLADLRGGLIVGACGIAGAVAGAALTPIIGGEAILLATAALILYVGSDMAVHAAREWYVARGGAPAPETPAPTERCESPLAPDAEECAPAVSAPGAVALAISAECAPTAAVPGAVAPAATAERSLPAWGYPVMGAIAGLYSGVLGLGGGFVLVPLLVRWARMPIKRAIGTSLVAISVLVVPGIATHWALGNIDPRIGLLLMVGSVPGAIAGARITRASSETAVRFGFAGLLVAVGLWLAVSEAIRLAGAR